MTQFQITKSEELLPSQLVSSLFVIEGNNVIQPISSMPGISRYSIDQLVKECKQLYQLGIRAIDLFAVIPEEKKNSLASEAYNPHGLLSQTIKAVKDALPELCVMVDIALDPFTDHGHDGLMDEKRNILNDKTLEVLGEMSVIAADAGADVMAPSDMMDGRVAYIRQALDGAGYPDVSILAYTAKYASSFYGPFREALNSAPKFGDKKTYQMNPANSREALLEMQLDILEGADFLLVKPGLPYLDVISEIREKTKLPLGAYQVSGEYSLIMAAAQEGIIDASQAIKESLKAIKRAGADFILTYGARHFTNHL